MISQTPDRRFQRTGISTKLDEKYSAQDVLKLTKNIYRVDTGDGQGIKISAIQKKTQELLNTLGVELLREN